MWRRGISCLLGRYFHCCRIAGRPGWGGVCFALLLAALTCHASEAEAYSEYQVKAVYLFNFTKYVAWPGDAFANSNAPFVIGVWSAPAVADSLTEIVRDKKVNGRAIEVRRLTHAPDARQCQIVFAGGTDHAQITGLLASLKDAPVLTVGETDRFLEWGGLINLANRGNNVRLQANAEAAPRLRLKFSAKLLSVSEVVSKPGRAKD